ncbi:GNAT family N-acetyltransferase [Nocardia colli]|uniref:GNAT family N-acetyltransferase n=1 Tax=Nocardia colli TaxID=2545717 RepID=A0A5N0EES4_9NOCA|nr:GNAT family N-acetyltransferase [Nocardia colli]KAA8887928.1 GNAT family N-acetyltransferase [Nocardia colli]
MVGDYHSAVPGIVAEEVLVRQLGVGDLPACLDLAADREWPREEVKWRLLLELGGGFGIDDPRGGLAATVFLTEVAPGIGAVGMLLVASRHGGRGLGRRLMEAALSTADCATVFLYATEAGRPLYTKLGFRVVDEVVSHTGVFTRGAHALGLPIDETGDLSALASLDRRAFGADRSVLLRSVLGIADRVVVAEGGYVIAWRNLGTVQAGPLVADSIGTATALLDAVLPEGGSARVDVGGGAVAELGGWLVERGLTARPPLPLMVLGVDLPGQRVMLRSPFAQALG